MDQPNSKTCKTVDKRENFACLICNTSIYQTVGARHHRKMRSQAEKSVKHSVANLILVCEPCHRMIHAHPAQSYENGWLVHSYAAPLDVPILTKAHGWVLLDNEGHWTPTQAQMQGEEQ